MCDIRRRVAHRVSVADQHNPYRAVLIRGHVSDELGDDEAVAIMDEMSNLYVGSDYPVRTAIVFVIEPDKVTFLDLPPVPSG